MNFRGAHEIVLESNNFWPCQFLCKDLCYYKTDSIPGTCNTMIWDDPHTEIVFMNIVFISYY